METRVCRECDTPLTTPDRRVVYCSMECRMHGRKKNIQKALTAYRERKKNGKEAIKPISSDELTAEV